MGGKNWAWRQTAPPSLTAGGAWRIPPGFTVRGTELGEKKRHSYPYSKHDTGQFFPPITYPTHRKKLAQRGDCRILRRCSVSRSLQLCRCLPKRCRAPTHGRRQHSEWANLCLETAFPFCCPPCQTKSCSEAQRCDFRRS